MQSHSDECWSCSEYYRCYIARLVLGKLKELPICQLPPKLTTGSIGEYTVMCAWQCEGKTLLQMNEVGWKLVHVIEDLDGGFGMILEKIH